MSAPERMTLIEELRLIGCHQNGDARCTCVVGNEAADIVQELAEALEVIAGSADDGDGWTSDGHERCTDIARAALAKLKEAGS